MNVSPEQAVSMAVNMKQGQAQEQAQISMLKKAIDTQAEGALALIESLPTIQTNQGLPANLGKNINVTA